MSDSLIGIELSDEEREVLWQGLLQWGGPAHVTDRLALDIGFGSAKEFWAHQARLREAVKRGEPLSAQDWRRVLVATEICFTNDILGAGSEWESVTGLHAEDTIRVLRGLQDKIPRTSA